MKLTENQGNRLRELDCSDGLEQVFASAEERDTAFREYERRGIEKNRRALDDYRGRGGAPLVNTLSERASSLLRGLGFIEVSTPLIISRNSLEKMTIGDDHALFKQVFWLGEKECLRPMLAPNLYDISKRLLSVYSRPLGVFEIGPCFRKESQGGRHLECFTMVNFVEWGVPESGKVDRLKELISLFMVRMGLGEYSLEAEDSVVYGDTIDVVVDGVEVASGALGPHPLDSAWDMHEVTWLGLGAGLERIVMLREGMGTIQKAGRSLRYLGGASLSLK